MRDVCGAGEEWREEVVGGWVVGEPEGWIELHRPDGEVVHIQVDQIVLVMSATNASANKRAQSRVQLANGFADVLESVDEVMKAIMNDDSIG